MFKSAIYGTIVWQKQRLPSLSASSHQPQSKIQTQNQVVAAELTSTNAATHTGQQTVEGIRQRPSEITKTMTCAGRKAASRHWHAWSCLCLEALHDFPSDFFFKVTSNASNHGPTKVFPLSLWAIGHQSWCLKSKVPDLWRHELVSCYCAPPDCYRDEGKWPFSLCCLHCKETTGEKNVFSKSWRLKLKLSQNGGSIILHSVQRSSESVEDFM